MEELKGWLLALGRRELCSFGGVEVGDDVLDRRKFGNHALPSASGCSIFGFGSGAVVRGEVDFMRAEKGVVSISIFRATETSEDIL